MASSGRAATSRQQPLSCVQANSGACSSSSLGVPACFGPYAPDMMVTPRRGEPGSDIKVQKPRTGMTIRLTPELLAHLQQPGPKPSIELVLKSVAEGGPVLIVDGVKYNTNAHQMAIGSEVHMVARTELAAENVSQSGPGPSTSSEHSLKKLSRTSMSMFASLHRKLIVQQVLTSAKRAEMRARTEGSARQIEEAKKRNMLVIDDRDEMLAAAEAIPVSQSPQPGVGQESRGGNLQERSDRKRPRPSTPTEGVKAAVDSEDGSLRDPMTAWFYDCYNHDDYGGHVSDLNKFLDGIDARHVMFRYHVKPDGTLDPDRRRFCVKFKTKGGRDLAVKRSGEALGAPGSWSPERVPVIRGRDETADDAPTDYLLVLPQGSSVAKVIAKVTARLPQDLRPAVTPYNTFERKHQPNSNDRARSYRPKAHVEVLESYRRDMLRAALGASLAGARFLGPERGAPDARTVGTDEDNAHRVATVAANEAARTLLRGGDEAGARGADRRRLHFPSSLTGGARAQRREATERETG